MKRLIKFFVLTLVIIGSFSCDDKDELEYAAPVKITFEGVDATNIVQVDKGVTFYKTKVTITATSKIRSLALYEVDAKTGAPGNQIGSDTIFNPSLDNYSFEYTVDDLTKNKGIMVKVEDDELKTFYNKMLVKITPSVFESGIVIIESSEAYYGPYFASWLSGRAYIKSDGEKYANEIDFSLGNIAITGTDTVAAFVSPDIRSEHGLPTISNLRNCKFELTTLSKSDFDAIPLTDASIINNLDSPSNSVLRAEATKVYLYENDTEKGLIYVAALQNKKGTLQQKDGSWVRNQTYHQLRIITKTVYKD